ncbi:O-antigen ligase family protein [Hydromonas duriensis]|uniref:O-antigen ligase family protein n=1 Tax=Hydromonas duriensis TaxID=1527608 RepID=UPI0013C347A6|nr:O-antigen ligase family protein [Hydromonas duriensis]
MASINAIPRLFDGMMILCLLISLGTVCSNTKHLDKQDRLFIGALCLYPLVSAISLLQQGSVELNEFDTLSRFLLCVPVYLFFRARKIAPQYFLVGALIACVCFGATALHEVFRENEARASGAINPITFGEISILFSFYTLLLLKFIPKHFDEQKILLAKALIILAAGLGLIACVLSSSRGPLIAVPFLALASLNVLQVKFKPKTLFVTCSVIICALVASLYIAPVASRVNDTLLDLKSIQQGNTNTSIGIRTEVWQASWTLFKAHPMAGVGKERLVEEIRSQQHALNVPSYALGYHAHNDYLQLLSELGIIGLMSVLALYLGAAFMARRAAPTPKLLVLGVCICWLTFGLTQVQLAHQRITLIEVITLVCFFAYYKNNDSIRSNQESKTDT